MKIRILLIFICFITCNHEMQKPKEPYIIVLGTAQDAGYPQANCKKKCCSNAWDNPENRKFVSCLALIDPISNKQWLFDATPDIKFQLHLLEKTSNLNPLDGIFLTHAHIGHYTGLMQLGREVMGVKNLPVYAMSRMESFLRNNAPWNQLINIQNINIMPLSIDSSIHLNKRISITPLVVPHRDEYSETVGYKITSENKSLLFIPDIDKWETWDTNIIDLIKEVDYAFLDGTFYKNGELNRDMSEIPHPFVMQSMELFKNLSNYNKSKIHFIHFNHTNPLLQNKSVEKQEVKNKGFNIAEEGMIISL